MLIYFQLSIRVGTKKCQDSRLSLNPSNALKGINITSLQIFFIHINMIDYMATAIHIQRQKFLKIKTETNGCIPHFLIMPDRVKLLTIPCKYTLTKAVFVSKAHAW